MGHDSFEGIVSINTKKTAEPSKSELHNESSRLHEITVKHHFNFNFFIFNFLLFFSFNDEVPSYIE